MRRRGAIRSIAVETRSIRILSFADARSWAAMRLLLAQTLDAPHA